MRNVKICVSLVFLLFILVSCAPKQEPVVQRVMIQCWDGSIAESIQQCPVKETLPVVSEAKIEEPVVQPVAEEPVVNKTIVQTFLENAPKTYWFYNDYEERGAVVDGDLRRNLYKADYSINVGAYYWNTRTRELFKYQGEISKSWWDANVNTPTKSNAQYLYAYKQISYPPFNRDTRYENSYYWFGPNLPKGPIEYMEEYKNDVPIKIERYKQTIETPLSDKKLFSNLTLYFRKIGTKDRVLAFVFDTHFEVPYKIQETVASGNYTAYISTTKFEFDTASHISFGRKSMHDFVKLEDNAVIVTDEYDKYITELWEKKR